MRVTVLEKTLRKKMLAFSTTSVLAAGLALTPGCREKERSVEFSAPCANACVAYSGDFVFKMTNYPMSVGTPGGRECFPFGCEYEIPEGGMFWGVKVARIDLEGVEFSPHIEVGGEIVSGARDSSRWRVKFGEERQLDSFALNLVASAERGRSPLNAIVQVNVFEY